MPRRAANREWNQLEKEKCVAVCKAGKVWRSEEHFNIRHGNAEFRVCPAGFGSYFVEYFLSIPSLCFGIIMYVLRHCVSDVYDLLFDFTGGYS